MSTFADVRYDDFMQEDDLIVANIDLKFVLYNKWILKKKKL